MAGIRGITVGGGGIEWWAAALVVGLVLGSSGMAIDSDPKAGNGKALTLALSQGERVRVRAPT